MPRRPLLAAAATLSTLTLLTACNGSPEAGRPNVAPVPSSSMTAPVKAESSTPSWTVEEAQAVAAAKSRYALARAAVDKALQSPGTATRAELLRAGNAGTWLTAIVEEINSQLQDGLYQVGNVEITTTSVRTVNLSAPQPEVQLTTCIDSAAVSYRYLKTGKPAPMAGTDGFRHAVLAQLALVPSPGQSKKDWVLIDEKDRGKC